MVSLKTKPFVLRVLRLSRHRGTQRILGGKGFMYRLKAALVAAGLFMPAALLARRLYAAAAADSGGTLQVYAPGVGRSPGRVMPVGQGPRQPGLAAAQQRLAALGRRDEGKNR